MRVARRKPQRSKEELERIAREQEAKMRLEETLRKERAAEERQAIENDRRDREEEEERKRAKKEEQIRLMAQKDAKIVALANELESQKALYTAERTELETELERMVYLKESLLNEISSLRSEGEETQRHLLEDRAQVVAENGDLQSSLAEERAAHGRSRDESGKHRQRLEEQLATVTKNLETLTNEKERGDREMSIRIKSLERELEKVNTLNGTLQEVLESREADDRKNVTLMQLLNNQLDETKRKSQEIVDEERAIATKFKQENITLEAKNQHLKEENDLLKREKEQIQRQAEADLHDYQSKVEQLKFDMKYLHSELHSFKSQCNKQQGEVTRVKASATAETQSARLELETLHKRVEELESLLRRKDREHFDKATFLNAQIANNRTIIAQLQQKLKSEREDREHETKAIMTEVENKKSALQLMNAEMDKKKSVAGDIEMKLSSDNSILKSTVYQLQAALVDREKEMDAMEAQKDEEIRRLRRKLDENFIPHRNDVALASIGDTDKPLEAVLGEKVAKLTRDMEHRAKASNEVEVRLKAQLSNQGLIIDSLQAELAKVKADCEDEIKLLEADNRYLKDTLETNCIPYKH